MRGLGGGGWGGGVGGGGVVGGAHPPPASVFWGTTMYSGYWGVTFGVLVPAVLVASWIDYSQRKVPNWLNASLAAMGFIAQGTFFGWSGMVAGILGLLVGLGVLILPWTMRAMGAGDVKLMAAIGVWFGPWMTLVSFVIGVAIGGVIALIMIAWRGRLGQAWANMGVILIKARSRETLFSDFGSAKTLGPTPQLLPYGVPLTMGSLFVLANQVFGWGMV